MPGKYLRVSLTWEIGCAGALGAAAIMQETWPMMARFLLMNIRQIKCNMRLKTLPTKLAISLWTQPEALERTLAEPSGVSGNIARKRIATQKSLKRKRLNPKHRKVHQKNRSLISVIRQAP